MTESHTPRKELEAREAGDASEQGDVTLLDIGLVLLKHKRSIFLFTLTCTLIAAAASLVLPKWYTASVTILPPKEQQSAATSLLGPLGSLASGSTVDLAIRDPRDIYLAMLRSRSISDNVIRRFDLRNVFRSEFDVHNLFGPMGVEDSRRRLARRMTAFLNKDGTISMSFEDHDPFRAAAVANAYVEELVLLSGRIATTEGGQRRIYYERKMQETNQQLLAAEVEMQRLQEKSGLIQPEEQGRAIIESVSLLQAQVTAKAVEVASIRTFAKPKNPDLVAAQKELAAVLQQLSNTRKRNREQGDVLLATSALPKAAMEYMQKAREVKYQQTLLELLGKQLGAARLDEGKAGPVIQVLDPAEVPGERSWPRRSLIVLVATLVAIFISSTRALIQETNERNSRLPGQAAKLDLFKAHFREAPWAQLRSER